MTTTELGEEVLKVAIADYARDSTTQWPLATASEACLALNVNGLGSDLCNQAEFVALPISESSAKPTRSAWKSYGRQLA